MAGPSRPTMAAASFRVSCGRLLLACRVLQGNTRLQNKHRPTLAAAGIGALCSIGNRRVARAQALRISALLQGVGA